MVPLYLRYFDLATYGAWLASGNIISLTSVLESGLSVVVTQKLAAAYGSNDLAKFSEISGSGMLASWIIGFHVALIGIVLSLFIPGWVNTPQEQHAPLTIAIILASAANGLSVIYLTLGASLQAWQRTVAAGLIGLLAQISAVPVIVIGLLRGWGIIAVGTGPLAVSLVYTFGFALYQKLMWRRLSLSPLSASTSVIWMLLKELKMLFLAKISGLFSSNIEGAVAAIFISPQAAAILTLTGRVIFIAQMFMDRIGSAVFAGVAHMSYKARSEHDMSAIREIIVISMVLAGLGLGMTLAFTKPILSLWVGPAVFGGIPLLLLISVSTFFSFRKGLTSNLTFALGRIRETSWYLIIDSFLRVILLVPLVSTLGLLGIPSAGAMAAGVAAVLLGSLLTSVYGRGQRNVYLPGTPGFVISLGIGVFWLLFAPEAKTWLSLTLQASLCGILMLVSTCLVDDEWRRGLRRNTSAVFNAAVLQRKAI